MNNSNPVVDKNSREYQENLIKTCRGNLLMVVLITAINLVVLLTGSDSYWLFSASIPYYVVAFGMAFDGQVIATYTITALVVAGAIIAVYLLAWLLSKKRSGWLTVALILFVLDTLGLVALMMWMQVALMDWLMPILFHAWVLLYLVQGVMAAKKLKDMPVSVPEGYYGTTPEMDP